MCIEFNKDIIKPKSQKYEFSLVNINELKEYYQECLNSDEHICPHELFPLIKKLTIGTTSLNVKEIIKINERSK
jgi:SUMO ligase MMS21 Smc5/6 complex component